MTNLLPVKAGDPFRPSAADWNAMLEAAGRPPAGRKVPLASSSGLQQIDIRNDTGADRLAGDVVKLSDPLFNPTDDEAGFRNRISLKGIAPSDPTTGDYHAILAAPIASGSIGPAWMAQPIIPARINVIASADVICGADAGAYLLKSGMPGWDIVWKQTGTGTKWAYITPSVVRIWLAKTTGTISTGATTASVAIWSGQPPASISETLANVHYNWAEDGSISSGKEVIVMLVNGIRRIVAKEC